MDTIRMNAAAEMKCDFKCGRLPECAPLAISYTPMQQKNPPQYAREEALARGTLFPGLDLPFMNKANSTNPYAGTPLGELMALDFMQKEMTLYMDTHPDDQEVFEALKSVIALAQAGAEKYTKLYGPITASGVVSSETYNWLDNPWPWEYCEGGAK